MAFPQVVDSSEAPVNSATLTWTVSYPTTVPIAAGDKLLLIVATRGGGVAPLTLSGWTRVGGVINSTTIGITVYERVATGTESGSFNMTLTSAQIGIWRMVHMTGTNNASVAAISGGSAVTTATPDPPSLTPAWGSADDLWFALAASADGRTTLTTPPTNYGNQFSDNTTGTTGGLGLSSARRELTAATEDPGTFTLSRSAATIAVTVSVRGSSVTAVSSVAGGPISAVQAIASVGLKAVEAVQAVVQSSGTSSVQYGADAFSRTISVGSGWGTADAGGGWTVFNSVTTPNTANFGVNGSAGSMALNVAGAERSGLLSAAHTDAEVLVRFQHVATPVGANVVYRGVLRGSDNANAYWGAVNVDTSNVGVVNMNVVAGGTQGPALAASDVSVGTLTVGSWYWIRFQAVGSTLRVKFWADGSAEPSTWTNTATDTTYSSGSYLGVSGRANTGNTSLPTILWDDFSAASVGSGGGITFEIPAGVSQQAQGPIDEAATAATAVSASAAPVLETGQAVAASRAAAADETAAASATATIQAETQRLAAQLASGLAEAPGSVAASAVAPQEETGGVQAGSTVQLETGLGVVVASAVQQEEAGAVVRTSAAAADEAGGVASAPSVVADESSGVSATRQETVEETGAVAAVQAEPVESTGAALAAVSQTAALPVDAAQAVAAQAVEADESGTAVGSASQHAAETTAGLASSLLSPSEAPGGVSGPVQLAGEEAAAVAAAWSAPLEEVRSVAASAAVALEIQAAVGSQALAALDGTGAVAASAAEVAEALAAVVALAQEQADTLGQTAVTAAAAVQLEIQAALSALGSATAESVSPASSATGGGIEETSPVAAQRQHALETVASIAQAVGEPIETLGQTLVSQSATLALDTLQALVAGRSAVMEEVASVRVQAGQTLEETSERIASSLAFQTETLRGAAGFGLVALDAAGEVVGVSALVVETDPGFVRVLGPFGGSFGRSQAPVSTIVVVRADAGLGRSPVDGTLERGSPDGTLTREAAGDTTLERL